MASEPFLALFDWDSNDEEWGKRGWPDKLERSELWAYESDVCQIADYIRDAKHD